MSRLKKIFKKHGGWGLIKQYHHSGALFSAIGVFFLLGKSRVALEILRLSTDLKATQKLQKKYKSALIKYDETYDASLPHVNSNKVWVCWFQGIENAPHLVQRCYQSLLDNLHDKEVILITEENMKDYVQLPKFILDKWAIGQITHTHLTDLLRLELLIKYGGLWVDSTVLCTRKIDEIPDYYFNSDLFVYQCLKPGRDGHSHINSSWLICAKTNNKVLMAVQHLCYEYWKEHNALIDYFLIHDFMAIVLEYYPEDWNKIIPSCNSTPHILLLRLFETYDERIWKGVKEMTCFHKLTNKFDAKNLKISGTYYDVLLNDTDSKE